jgi:hypothetical protein
LKNKKIIEKTVRRSVAIPSRLVGDVVTAAPIELKNNFNRLVILALEEFVAQRRKQAFATAMAEMACDPAIKKESESIVEDFRMSEGDGL